MGIIKYGVGACAEFVCNVNITAYTFLPHNTQISIPSAGFEDAVPVSDRSQTDALDRAATGDRLWMCWWWEECSHHSPQPEIPTDMSGLSMSEPVAWKLLIRNVRFFGLNVLFVIYVTMLRHSQGCAFRSNRRSSVPIKMAAKIPTARTAMMWVTWRSVTLLMSDFTLATFPLFILINPVRSIACSLKYIYLSTRRKNQRMTQVKMFIHFKLTQHISGIIMPIVRRQTE